MVACARVAPTKCSSINKEFFSFRDYWVLLQETRIEVFPSIAFIAFDLYWTTALRDPLKPLCGSDLQCRFQVPSLFILKES